MPYAAPTGLALSALVGVRNAVVNGDMRVNQRRPVNITTAVNLTGGATAATNNVDNWPVQHTANFNTAIINDAQVDDHPLLSAQGFSKSAAVTTAEAAIAAAEFCLVRAAIEPINFRNFANGIGVLQWQCKSPKAGLHYVGLLHDGGPDSYIIEYNIAQPNTWQQFFAGISFGTIPFSNDGLQISFPLAAGSAFRTSNLFAWQLNQEFYAGPGQQNLLDTIGNTFRVTDVQLELGVVSTPFDREPFADLLARCQRYYWDTGQYGQGTGAGPQPNMPIRYRVKVAGVVIEGVQVIFPVTMQNIPAVTLYNPADGTATWRNNTLVANSGAALSDTTPSGAFLRNTQVVGDAVGNDMQLAAAFNAGT